MCLSWRLWKGKFSGACCIMLMLWCLNEEMVDDKCNLSRNETIMIIFSSIGNYKLTTVTLGKGSFSKVALADHIILKKKVALKLVMVSKIKDPYVSRNLKREAAIMAKLDHPNIVTLHEVVSAGDFYCLVLDFYSGGNLCDMIGNQETFRLGEELARLDHHHRHSQRSYYGNYFTFPQEPLQAGVVGCRLPAHQEHHPQRHQAGEHPPRQESHQGSYCRLWSQQLLGPKLEAADPVWVS